MRSRDEELGGGSTRPSGLLGRNEAELWHMCPWLLCLFKFESAVKSFPFRLLVEFTFRFVPNPVNLASPISPS